VGNSLRLGIVDDHPAILRGVLAGLLDFLPDVVATRTALCVEPLIEDRRNIDLVILDVNLGDDTDAAQNVAALVDAGLPVLLYTQGAGRALIARCFRAGASGIVAKSADLAALAEAIRVIASGHAYLNPEWAAAVEDGDDLPMPELTPREAESLRLYATGLPLKSVARRMDIAEGTAKEHLDRVRDKYAATGRPAYSKVDLYVRAVEDGYLPAPAPDNFSSR